MRPMGDWSIITVVEIRSAPSILPAGERAAPPAPRLPRPPRRQRGSGPMSRALCRASSERKITSCTSVDLPDPETPVTATIMPSGISTSMFFRLWVRAPTMRSRRAGIHGAPLARGRDAQLAAQVARRERVGGRRP